MIWREVEKVFLYLINFTSLRWKTFLLKKTQLFDFLLKQINNNGMHIWAEKEKEACWTIFVLDGKRERDKLGHNNKMSRKLLSLHTLAEFLSWWSAHHIFIFIKTTKATSTFQNTKFFNFSGTWKGWIIRWSLDKNYDANMRIKESWFETNVNRQAIKWEKKGSCGFNTKINNVSI